MHPWAGSSHAAGSSDDAAAAAVALRGASLAFQKKPPALSASSSQSSVSSTARSSPPNHLHGRQNTTGIHQQRSQYRDNGALRAATSSVERARSSSRPAASVQHQQHSPLASQVTGGSSPEVDPGAAYPAGLVAARLQQLGAGPASGASPASSPLAHLGLGYAYGAQSSASSGALGTTAPAAKLDAKSPSLIAATLAASRSVSPSPKTKHAKRSRSVDALGALNAVEAVDSAPIPPTGSLVSMFERSRKPNVEHQGTDTKLADPKLRSPKPSIEQVMARDQAAEHKEAEPAGPGIVSVPMLTARSKSKEAAGKVGAPSQNPTATNRKSKRRSPSSQTSASEMRTSPVACREHASPNPQRETLSIQQAAASKPRILTPKDGKDVGTKSRFKDPDQATADDLKRSNTVSVLRKPKQASPTRNIDQLASQATAKSKPMTSPKTTKLDRPTTPKRRRSPTPQVISRSTTNVLSPQPTRVTPSSLRTTTPPPPIILRPSADKPSSPANEPEKRQAKPKKPPTPPQPRKSQRLVPSRATSRSRTRSHSRGRGTSDVPQRPPISMYGLPIVSTSSQPKAIQPKSASPHNRRLSAVSAPPSPTHEPPRRRRLTQPLSNSTSPPMHVDKLTSAIMAGSLASSRLTPHHTGSSLPPPSLPSRQRSPRLLQTLRQPVTGDDDEHDKHKKSHHRHRLHSSKHMHHEGSRSKWREKITDRERRRYEAVWASNRGRLLTYESPTTSIGSGLGTELCDYIVNIVVRDIWKRSRLPDDELAETWSLVDREGRGYLNRQEFVVGMWLIDQRLRGRKLPPRVSDSVWSSVNGVTVLRPKKGR